MQPGAGGSGCDGRRGGNRGRAVCGVDAYCGMGSAGPRVIRVVSWVPVGPDKQYQSSSKPLLYYPEENHMPNEQSCQDFNSRIMKHLMK